MPRHDRDRDVADQRGGHRADRLLDAPGASARSCSGGVNPNSQSVIAGRSISRNSARNVSVTIDSSEPNTPPAMPSSVLAASGQPGGQVLERVADLVVGARRADEVVEPVGLLQVVPVARKLLDEVDDLVPDRPGREHDRQPRPRRTARRTRRAPPGRAPSRGARARRRPDRARARSPPPRRSRAACRSTARRAPRARRTRVSVKSVRTPTTTSTRWGGMGGLWRCFGRSYLTRGGRSGVIRCAATIPCMARRQLSPIDRVAANLLAVAWAVRIVWRLTRGRAPWERRARTTRRS